MEKFNLSQIPEDVWGLGILALIIIAIFLTMFFMYRNTNKKPKKQTGGSILNEKKIQQYEAKRFHDDHNREYYC